MKKTVKISASIAAAVFMSAAFSGCQEKIGTDSPDADDIISSDDVYEVVIEGCTGTKSGEPTKTLGLKDATRSGQNFTATLKKNGEKYTGTVGWTWTKSNGTYFNSAQRNDEKNVVDLSSVEEGSGGGMIATASISGTKVAESGLAKVVVEDDRDHVYLHPKTVSVQMRIKRNYSRTGELSISPSLSICDCEVFEADAKEVDMASPQTTVYLSWSFDTTVSDRFNSNMDDCHDDRDYSDFSWWAILKDIIIYSENGYLNGNYKYSIMYGSYASSLQNFTTSGGAGNSYDELHWSNYYNEAGKKDSSKEGRGKAYCNPVTENNYAASLVSSGISSISWEELPERNFTIYVDLDLSEAGNQGL